MQSTTGPNNPLGLNLDFLYGRGYLWAEAHPINDWLTLENFRMEIPGLKFPFQSDEGLAQFRHTRCLARVIELSVSEKKLRRLVTAATKSITGFYDIEFSFLNGTVLVSARVRTLKFETLITFQIGVITPEPPDSDHIELSIFDYRAYGPLPVSIRIVVSDLITKILGSPEFFAITGGSFALTRELDVLRIRPLKLSLLHLFTRCGWKLPDLTDINRFNISIRPGRLSLLATRHGEEPLLKPKGRYNTDTQLRSDALAEYETKKLLASSEKRIFKQEFELAIRDLEAMYESLGDHLGVLSRLLDLLLATPSEKYRSHALQLLDHIEKTDFTELLLRSRLTLAYLEQDSDEKITESFLALDHYLCKTAHRGSNAQSFNHGILLFALARHLEKLQPEQAVMYALRSQELLPNCVSVHYLLEHLYDTLQQPQRREEVLRRLVELELDPQRSTQLLLSLSELLIYDLNRPEEAKPYLENARKLTKNPRVDELTAEIFIQNQSYTRAIKTLTACAEGLDPMTHSVSRALLYEKIGVIWFQHLYNPAQANIFVLKAHQCLSHAEKTKANATFLQLLEAKFNLTSANICLSRGQSNEALGHLSKIFSLFDLEPNLIRYSELDPKARMRIGEENSVSIVAEATLRQATIQHSLGRTHAAKNALTNLFRRLRPNDYPSIKEEVIAHLAILWLALPFTLFKAELLTAAFAKFGEEGEPTELARDLARDFLNSKFVNSLANGSPHDPNTMFDSSDDTPISTNQQFQAIAFCVSVAETILRQAAQRPRPEVVPTTPIQTPSYDDTGYFESDSDDDFLSSIDAEFEDLGRPVSPNRATATTPSPIDLPLITTVALKHPPRPTRLLTPGTHVGAGLQPPTPPEAPPKPFRNQDLSHDLNEDSLFDDDLIGDELFDESLGGDLSALNEGIRLKGSVISMANASQLPLLQPKSTDPQNLDTPSTDTTLPQPTLLEENSLPDLSLFPPKKGGDVVGQGNEKNDSMTHDLVEMIDDVAKAASETLVTPEPLTTPEPLITTKHLIAPKIVSIPASIRSTLPFSTKKVVQAPPFPESDDDFNEDPTAETEVNPQDESALVLFREKLLATNAATQEWSREDILDLAALSNTEMFDTSPQNKRGKGDEPGDQTMIDGLFTISQVQPPSETESEKEIYQKCSQVIQEARLDRNYPQLADALERILELHLPEEEGLNYQKELGELYFYELEDNENARFHLERVRAADPQNRGQNRTLLTALETIYEESNQPEDRLAILKIRLEGSESEEKGDVYRLLIARLVWDTARDAQQVRHWIQPLLDRDPHDEAANRLLVDLAVDQGNWEGAAVHLLTVLETSTGGLDAVETRRKLAEIYLDHLDNPNAARNHYLEVLSDAPGDSNAIHRLRECYRRLKDWDGVCGTLLTELGLLAGRFNPIPISDIGSTIAAISPSLKPAAAEVLTEYAYLLEEQIGDLSKAFYTWTMILEILPENLDALDHHMLLARILERPRDLADDLVVMSMLLTEPQVQGEMLLEAIEIYISFGNYQDTVEQLLQLYDALASRYPLSQELMEQAEALRDAARRG